jgi:orotidine-5'-phosphate decarboxylase
VAAVGDSALTYKVGMQLYTAEGPQVVRDLVASGRRVFLDLKYHDIPNTVGAAVAEAAKLGVSMLTVHAAGSARMLRAAVEAAKVRPELIVLAITVLTSMDGNDLEKIGMQGTVKDSVCGWPPSRWRMDARAWSRRRGRLLAARKTGTGLRHRDPGRATGGQQRGRSGTRGHAGRGDRGGSQHIVVGRPITEAADPAAEAQAILGQMNR